MVASDDLRDALSVIFELSELNWPGPEEPEQAPLLPDYVPGPEHADDEIIAEDQPGAEDASPTVQSPDYVPETDPEADSEEDDDEDPEEDPIDYPANGGDDGDDEMGIEEDEDDDIDIEADEEDEDDEMDVEVDEEAEEEHPAPAYPVVVALPATSPSAEETEPFKTDESAAYFHTSPCHMTTDNKKRTKTKPKRTDIETGTRNGKLLKDHSQSKTTQNK
ncbi:hypothetical protein Tco_0728524 [Tanacetum coccineum]|uniref:Uncharacterized protein n=1 Tax=Tanacetum coccineum TaxID=301880 RepID=A0ABQ4YLC2_9ASTR